MTVRMTKVMRYQFFLNDSTDVLQSGSDAICGKELAKRYGAAPAFFGTGTSQDRAFRAGRGPF
jgi:hypothetical protein